MEVPRGPRRGPNLRIRIASLALALTFLSGPLIAAAVAADGPMGGEPKSQAGAPLAVQTPAVQVAPGPSAPESSPSPGALYTNGTPVNWSPYSPSTFTHGTVALVDTDLVNITAFPNLTVATAGNYTVRLNGTWSAGTLSPAAREWVMVVVVKAGVADTAIVYSNATITLQFVSGDVPGRIAFALPSSRAFANATSDATVVVTPPSSNATRFNLTAANAGAYLGPLHGEILPIATKALRHNMSGTYSNGGALNGTQNMSVLIPHDGQPPITVRTGTPTDWAGSADFPGGRFMRFSGGGPIAVGPALDAVVWTRGSPESGLFVNASLSPTDPFRGDLLTVSGSAGNRSLIASTNWTANTTAALSSPHDETSCPAPLRLDNGSFRLFCVVRDDDTIIIIIPVTTWGIRSAWSADGINWRWESGIRYERCSGEYAIEQAVITRRPSGILWMYYTGSAGAGCSGSSTNHVSLVSSDDDGLTWTLVDEEITFTGSITAPDVRAIVPLPDGRLRMYLESSGGPRTAVSGDGVTWAIEATPSVGQPRAMYALTGGGYKAYYGTVNVQSRTSTDGRNWSNATTELTNWGSSIRAGPILDRGDGRLLMLVFVPSTGGLHVATLGTVATVAANVSSVGTGSTGLAFGSASADASGAGAFSYNLTLPASAPIGRVTVPATAWFGGPELRGVALNRVPVWAGPSVINATEDVPLILNLSAYVTDADGADILVFTQASPYGSLNGSLLTLLYTTNMLSDTVNGTATDAYDPIAFSFAVNITPVNDPPALAPNASYVALEDSSSPVDFGPAISDEDTPLAQLNLTTNVSGATVSGFVVTFLFTVDGTVPLTLFVTDGQSTTNNTTVIIVTPVDDAPVLTLAPTYAAQEDAEAVLNFSMAISDEDTPLASITLSTNLTGASVQGPTVRVTFTDAQLVPFNVTVFDGTTYVTDDSVLVVGEVNDPPVWNGTPALQGEEDVPFIVPLGPFVVDPDNVTATLTFGEDSQYATIVNGSEVRVLLPEGVLQVTLNLTVFDGNTTATITVVATASPVNDPPSWDQTPQLGAVEDMLLVVDLGLYVDDVDNATSTLIFGEDSPYATIVNGSELWLQIPEGVTQHTVNLTVFDGNTTVPLTVVVTVSPVNDPPAWNGPLQVDAEEDIALFIELEPLVSDMDNLTSTLTFGEDSPYASIASGNRLRLTYPNGVLQDRLNLTVFDGTTSATLLVNVTVAAINDLPEWVQTPPLAPQEDVPLLVDLTLYVQDIDNNLSELTFGAASPNATINGTVLRLLYGEGITTDSLILTVSDGSTPVELSIVVSVEPVNDAPAWVSAPAIGDLHEDEPEDVDLAPYVTDVDDAVATLVFTSSSPYATFEGAQMTLTFPQGVLSETITLTVSDGEFSRDIAVSVTVEAVNDAPILTGTPPTNSTGGATVTFQFGAQDEDHTTGFLFSATAGPAWITVSPAGLLTVTPPTTGHGWVNYTVRVTDALGLASAPVDFSFALPTNELPSMSPNFTQLPANATPGVPFWNEFNVTDPDGDPVTVTALWVDSTQTVVLRHLTGSQWRFEWTPNYVFPPTQNFFATFNGSLLLSDGFGSVSYSFSLFATVPPAQRPVFSPVPKQVAVTGTNITINLWDYVHDNDTWIDADEFLEWSFQYAGVYQYDYATGDLTIFFGPVGLGTIKVTVTDSVRLSAERVIELESTALPGSQGVEQGFPPWWLLWLLLIGGAAIGGTIAYRRMHRRPVALADPVARAPPAAMQEPVMAPAAAEKRRAFLVEDVFLLYRDGRLIFNRSGLGADAVEDAESVGSMLVAVQDFVRDSFKKGGDVDRMGYGDSVILIERGESVILAITVFGEPDAEYRDMMREAVRKVEMTYAGVIEEWDGSRSELSGVEAILQPLWMLTSDLTRGDVLLATTAKEVQMLSGVEFFQGYIRLKVGIVNNTQTVITNVTVDIDYSADVLRLQKIEPASYKMAGAKVMLGVLQSGEKATLAYYFDPQICTSSAIDGTCRYKDASGQQHIVQMKSRQAEVVCPLFFTKEHANTATLKRLVETELNQFDVRAYSFDHALEEPQLEKIFTQMKGAIAAHDVQIVRSFERRRPYKAEAWFYGKTQKKGYQMVIRVWVDSARHRAEFYTASTAMPPVTGLLAELHHTFTRGPLGDLVGLGVQPLFAEEIRKDYEDPRGVSKMIEGESPAGETDAP